MEKSFKFYVGVFKIVLFEIKSQYEDHLSLSVFLIGLAVIKVLYRPVASEDPVPIGAVFKKKTEQR